jgi:hypothetical protein
VGTCADVLAFYPEMCGGLYYEHEPAFCAVWSVYAEIFAVAVVIADLDHFHELSLLLQITGILYHRKHWRVNDFQHKSDI